MIVGPRQVLFAGDLAAGTYTLGSAPTQSGMSTRVLPATSGGSPGALSSVQASCQTLKDTMGAMGVVFRAYASTSTGTLVFIAPYLSWDGVSGGIVSTQAFANWQVSMAAAAASTFITAAGGLHVLLTNVDAAPGATQPTNWLPITVPSLMPRITVATATINQLVIEAKCLYPEDHRFALIPPNSTAIMDGIW